jgi:hypothetical protein
MLTGLLITGPFSGVGKSTSERCASLAAHILPEEQDPIAVL